ncbi:hypothetical protein GCM10025877_16810 [Agromyces mangrovi Wang et al. 2018]|nr:hypothetical protein GCM10025877_16810 [Agromyces mangrovi]
MNLEEVGTRRAEVEVQCDAPPPLTTVSVDYGEVGRRAMARLLCTIRDVDPPEFVLPVSHVVWRGSTGPPPASTAWVREPPDRSARWRSWLRLRVAARTTPLRSPESRTTNSGTRVSCRWTCADNADDDKVVGDERGVRPLPCGAQ